jgi:hypothetical protein
MSDEYLRPGIFLPFFDRFLLGNGKDMAVTAYGHGKTVDIIAVGFI